MSLLIGPRDVREDQRHFPIMVFAAAVGLLRNALVFHAGYAYE